MASNDSGNNNKPAPNANDITRKLRSNEPRYIVGVGASAGGLAAIKALLEHFPPDLDAAVIIVQHLSPDFETYMDELLEKHSALPIKLAKDLETIEANTVYLLPARKHLSVASNKIILSEVDDRPIHHPIDYLFRSLAEARQNEAVGIVLSGTGNDGSRGVLELRKMGALTLAQIPQSAEFDGMPHNAIATGHVDLVLEPEQMGYEIAKYLRNRAVQDAPKAGVDRDRIKQLNAIFDAVLDRSKMDLRSYKLSTVERRIQHRMGILGLEQLNDYVEYFLRSEEEQDLLIDDISIGVTQFFRNPEIWTILRNQVLERMILESAPDEVLRIWVPGCSTGEEAYTLSILFEEIMESLGERRDVRIFASDIDRSAIRTAGLGRYSSHIEQDIPQHLLNKYFSRDDEGYVALERVRKRVVFAAHNLIEDPPFSNMNLVSCRNLLIYFQVNAQKDILSFLHFSLKPDGYLLLGEAETTSSLPDYFIEVDHALRLYQRAKNTRVSLSMVGLDERLARHKKTLKIQERSQKSQRSFDGTIPRIKEKLFNNFVPPTVVLDSSHNLVYSFGDTDAFTKKIKPGSHSLHYGRLLQDSLVSVISSLIKQVDKSKRRIVLTDVEISESQLTITIDACYVPLGEGVFTGHYLFSLIRSGTMVDVLSEVEAESALSPSQSELRIKQLDAELLDARVLLGEKQQDVEALTEELQSTNEELMAANEELQSTNEELQSVNEELFTVNTEYQEKIEELLQSNKDLDSLLNATEVGVVYLDKHFLIRRFTPKTREYINLLPLDINRPFTDIALNFDISSLEAHLNEVKRKQKRRHVKVNQLRGHDASILLTFLPYLDNKEDFEGIIMVFQDLDAFERAAAQATGQKE